MGRIAAIGAEAEVRGFGLAGVLVLPAEDDESARGAWRALPADVTLVILGPNAAAAVDLPGERGRSRVVAEPSAPNASRPGTGTAPIVAVLPPPAVPPGMIPR